jgi:hypothetical protein
MLSSQHLVLHRGQEPLGPIQIRHTGGTHQGACIRSLSGPVIAPEATYHGRLDRLAFENGRMQRAVEGVPETLQPPQPEVMINHFPRRQIRRPQAPGTAAPEHIEKRIEEVMHCMPPRPTARRRGRHEGSKIAPLGVGDIRRRWWSAHSPHRLSIAGGQSHFSDSLSTTLPRLDRMSSALRNRYQDFPDTSGNF